MWWIVAIVAAVVAVVAAVVAVVVAPVVAAVVVTVLIVIAVIAAIVAVVALIVAIIDTFNCDDTDTASISVLSDFNNEVDEPVAECRFGWNAKFRIEELEKCILQITLRIKLIFEASITEQEKTNAKDLWEQAIEDTWTDAYKLTRTEGDCSCEKFVVKVNVNWVENNEHHAVNVDPGNDRSNMLQWHIEDDGQTAAHEAGHMMGNPDEYEENDVCPNRDVRTDNTIMGSGSKVKKRHYETFAAWISNNTGCIYQPKC